MDAKEIEKRIAAAPNPSFRVRAVHEYGTIRRLTRAYLDMEQARILDFGCGTGIAAASYALRHPRATVFGVDVVPPNQEGLTQQYQEQAGISPPNNLSLFCSEAGSLPTEVDQLDLIYAWSVFEHVRFADLAETLKLIKGRLRSDGLLFLQINPLYFSPRGSHLCHYDLPSWAHLLEETHILKEKVMNSKIAEGTKIREWEQFESLNRATADDIKEAAVRAGFFLVLEERVRTAERVPTRLLRAYDMQALLTEELRLLLM